MVPARAAIGKLLLVQAIIQNSYFTGAEKNNLSRLHDRMTGKHVITSTEGAESATCTGHLKENFLKIGSLAKPVLIGIAAMVNYTVNYFSRGKQFVLVSRESRCFLRGSRGKHQDSRVNKTNCLPR